MLGNPRDLDQPKRCWAAVFQGAGQPLELREFSIPEIREREALVRIECCTICGSDLHTLTGKRQEAVPSILGHEALGVVSTVGDPPLRDIFGTPLQRGDRVTWSTSISCGECDRCLSGLPQKCRTLAKYGHSRAEGRYALSGGLAEYILLRPGSTVMKPPPEVPDKVICPVNCATATVAAAYRMAGGSAGRRVLIFGAGMLGLTAAAFGKIHQAAQVVVCDVNPDRLLTANRFGADAGVQWHADEEEFRRRLAHEGGSETFDVILELSGASDAVEAACRAGDIGAQIVLVGSVMPSRAARIDAEQIVRRWLTIQGVHNYAPEDLRTAIEFLSKSHTRFPFAKLVEFTDSLERINQAVETALQTQPVRLAIRPERNS